MFKILKECFELLTQEQKKKLFFLQVLIIIMSAIEIFSIFVVGAYISILSNLNNFLNTNNNVFFNIYHNLNFRTQSEFLVTFSIFIFFIFLFTSLFSIFITWKLSMYSSKIGFDISTRLYKYYINKSWIFHVMNNSNNLVNKISEETQRVTSGIISGAIYLNAKVILVIFTFLAILIYNPFISIIVFSFFIFSYWILYIFLKKKMYSNGEQLSKEQEKRFKLMGEGFGGIKDLLLSKRQDFFINLFQKASNKYAYHFGNNQVLSQVPKYAIEFLAFSSIIILILYLLKFSKLDLNTNDILPILAVYGFAGFKMLPAFQQIYYSLSTIKGNISAYKNIRSDLFESLKNDSNEFKNVNIDIKDAYNEIEFDKNSLLLFKDVCFFYPNMKRPSVSNINIKIEKNSIIGFVGPTGSGKSTIIDLLLGLLIPTTGKIFFNGQEMSNENIIKWQSKCAYVAQNIFLADTTVKENIAFGVPPDLIDNNKILYAAKLAQINEFIDTLPFKLDTEVGERGVQLSGGQRQRIGIARALYNDAEILVFDEATSSLDLITEKLIMNAINEFSGIKTVIIIAHRLETVKKCNYIYLIDNGKVVDNGNYEALSKNSRLFQGISGLKKIT